MVIEVLFLWNLLQHHPLRIIEACNVLFVFVGSSTVVLVGGKRRAGKGEENWKAISFIGVVAPTSTNTKYLIDF